MEGYKLQKSTDSEGNERYHLTLNKELVQQLGWSKGDVIDQDLTIGGSGAGKIKLDKLKDANQEQ